MDSVWQKIEQHGWKTNIAQRSACTGKEKEVDTSMTAAELVCTACEEPPSTTVVVSGDSDFVPGIEIALQKGWKVEVYSWEHATATKVKRLSGRANRNVKLVYLDQYLDRITFVDRKYKYRLGKGFHPNTERVSLDMKPDASPDNEWYERLEKVTKWPFQFYWHNAQYLVLVFRKTDSSRSFNVNAFLEQVNRYLPAGVNSAQKLLCSSVAYHGDDTTDWWHNSYDSTFDDDDLSDLDELCSFKFCCWRGVECYDAHTDNEIKYFEEHEGSGHPRRKIELCTFYARNGCNKDKKDCDYAHGEEDAFCPNCGKNGHFEKNCTVVRTM